VGLEVNGRNRYPRGAINLPKPRDVECQTSAVEGPSRPHPLAPWTGGGPCGDPDASVMKAVKRLHLPPTPADTGETVAGLGLNRGRSLALASGAAPGLHRTFLILRAFCF